MTSAGTCMVAKTCTTDCLFTGKPCTRYGFTFTSPLRMLQWFTRDRRRKTLWRAVRGEWVEVATSTSAGRLADHIASGTYVVMPSGIAPTVPAPEFTEVAPVGCLF